MAESCGVSYDVLAWTAEWYFQPKTWWRPTLRSGTTTTGCRWRRRSGRAVTALCRTGRQVDEEVLAHIWPSHHANVYGIHSVDVGGELAKLDTDGYWPLGSLAITTGQN